jgi:hypothetical protein
MWIKTKVAKDLATLVYTVHTNITTTFCL